MTTRNEVGMACDPRVGPDTSEEQSWRQQLAAYAWGDAQVDREKITYREAFQLGFEAGYGTGLKLGMLLADMVPVKKSACGGGRGCCGKHH